MNITVDTGAATIITAILVGLVSAFTTIIANRHSLKQLKLQWEREEKRAERAERQAAKDRELERQKALIDRLQEIYGNAIASLTTLPVLDQNPTRLEYATNLAEAQKWLSLVLACHYDKQSEGYNSFLDSYREIGIGSSRREDIWKLRDMIIEFASSDPRLQQGNKND